MHTKVYTKGEVKKKKMRENYNKVKGVNYSVNVLSLGVSIFRLCSSSSYRKGTMEAMPYKRNHNEGNAFKQKANAKVNKSLD